MISLKRNDSNAETQRRFQDAMHVAAGLLNWVLPDSESIVGATSHEGEEIHVQLLMDSEIRLRFSTAIN